jgi:anti-sigma factor RsiW
VSAHLEACAPCREINAEDAALDRALTALPSRTAPSTLKQALAEKYGASKAANAPRGPRSLLPLFIAAALVAALAVVVVRRGEVDALTVEAVNDHLRVLYAERPIEIASGGIHQVKPWFAGKLDFAPVIAFEGDDDFPLKGGAVGYFIDRKAATFFYERRLHPISLFVFRADGLSFPVATAAAGRVRAHMEDSRGFHSIVWRDGDLGYALVSDLNRDELRSLAQRIVGQ